MRGVNKVILVGTLGAAPDVRYMPNGNAVANVSLATNERWKDQQGQVQERTEWHRLAMYKRLAEIAGEYLAKGSRIYIEGKLRTRKWQDEQGQDRYTTDIVVDSMQMLGGKHDGNASNQPQSQQHAGQQSGQRTYTNQPNPREHANRPPMAEPDFDFMCLLPFAPMFKQYRGMHYAV